MNRKMNHRDTESTEFKMFVEEVWYAVCRLRVGSGLTDREVARALKQVIVSVELTETVEDE